MRLLIFAAIFLAGTSWAAPAKTQKLFIVFSYPLGQWSQGIVSGLSQQLRKLGIPFEFKQYVYDSPYFLQKGKEEKKAEVEKVARKAQLYRPDFIIVCDDEAADELMPGLKQLKIPLLFLGINKEERDITWLEPGAELTGVFERYRAQASLKLLKNLTKGKVKNISIITSENPTSKIITRQFQDYFTKHRAPVTLRQVTMSAKWDEWKSKIMEANKDSDSLLVLVPWNVKGAGGEPMDLRVMGKWLSANIKIPSISIVDVNLHLGVMASVSLTPRIMGEELAGIIRTAVVEHQALSDIPYRYPSKYEIIVNKKQADRLGIEIPIDLLEYAQVIQDEDLPAGQ